MESIPLDLLLEYLDLADGYCLWMALGCPRAPREAVSQVCSRMGLRLLPWFTLRSLGKRLNDTQRCCRCGRPCRLAVRGLYKVQTYLCTPCSCVHLASRRQISRALPRPSSGRQLWGRFTLARLSVTGAHLYWVHQVKRASEFEREFE